MRIRSGFLWREVRAGVGKCGVVDDRSRNMEGRNRTTRLLLTHHHTPHHDHHHHDPDPDDEDDNGGKTDATASNQNSN
mgnify:CR=1 FL=1